MGQIGGQAKAVQLARRRIAYAKPPLRHWSKTRSVSMTLCRSTYKPNVQTNENNPVGKASEKQPPDERPDFTSNQLRAGDYLTSKVSVAQLDS